MRKPYKRYRHVYYLTFTCNLCGECSGVSVEELRAHLPKVHDVPLTTTAKKGNVIFADGENGSHWKTTEIVSTDGKPLYTIREEGRREEIKS